MFRILLVAPLLLILPAYAQVQSVPEPKIQIAVLLDTSGSMDGLLNQTREQLWRIVNTFVSAKKEGQRARLELALYQYGNDSISSSAHHVQLILPLTTDLDKISEALFKLTTNGGNEYCGAAISHALSELNWSTRPGDLKLVYIAGNEPFTQGPISFRESVKNAINRGIVVNTIHAGTQEQGIQDGWLAAAQLADGNYLFIDSNRAIAQVKTPQDAELARLSRALNDTYVAYGAKGGEAAARQVDQDKNAANLSASSIATRAGSKASALYRNSEWDLIDARKEGKAVPTAELPQELKQLSENEREAFLAKKTQERTTLQQQIAKLSAERERAIASELKNRAQNSSKSMDDALIESARAQAQKAKYVF